MCGLAGRFHPVSLPAAPAWAARADALLAHRGPDGGGHFADDRCELVHRRLALLDLTPTGNQPMPNETGDVQVVFNGEIYNHEELRRRLRRRGHHFRGTSDTEVLVHLYEDAGDGMVEMLRGIFAFALYDQRRRRLLLARDRFGVKPLFYAITGDQCVFASEMKAIAALPGFRPQLDRQACYDFLSLGYVPEPATGFANIAALPKGTLLSISPDGVRERRWHVVAARPEAGRLLPQTVEVVAERLLEATRLQSVADVPVAALLSGGIDSSLIVAARGHLAPGETTTFSVRFPDADHDETSRAQSVARHCGTRHVVVHPSEQRLAPEAVFDLFRAFDQPFADTSLIPMYWVASAVRDQGIRCTLSGDGGDEAFGGYARFWRANRLQRLMNAPACLRRTAAGLGRLMTARTRDWGRQVAKAARLAEAGRHAPGAVIAGLSSYLDDEQKSGLVRSEAALGLLPAERLFEGTVSTGGTPLEDLSRRMTDSHFAVSLPSDMLRKVDMMSMRASLEIRVPLLDEDLVDLGLRLPHRLKTDGHSGKLVLRELAARWLPRDIAAGAKHGFTIPLDVMLPPAFHHAAADLLRGAQSYTRPLVNGALVDHWLAAFAAARQSPGGGAISRGGLYQRVMMLLALELWQRDFALSW